MENLRHVHNRMSVVGIAISYGLDNRGGWCSSTGRVTNFLHVDQTGSREPTQPHIQCVPGVKRPGRETDNSPLCSEVDTLGRVHEWPVQWCFFFFWYVPDRGYGNCCCVTPAINRNALTAWHTNFMCRKSNINSLQVNCGLPVPSVRTCNN
jgi:hypothetical protein